jgi:alpha-galactosidase
MHRRAFIKLSSILAVMPHLSAEVSSEQTSNRALKTGLPEVIASQGTWILRNGLVSKELRWDNGGLLGTLSVDIDSSKQRVLPTDMSISTPSGKLPAGEFHLVSDKHTSDRESATLALCFANTSGLELTLRYICKRGDAAIEQSCTIQNSGKEPIHGLPQFNSMLLALEIPSKQATVCWVEGTHDGSKTIAVEPLRTYLVRARNFEERDVLDLDSGRLSSNEKLPAVVIACGGLSYFAGLNWSGEWSITTVKTGTNLTIQARLADFDYVLAPGETLESPSAFYGVIRGTTDDAWNAIHTHCRAALMPKVDQDFPWVTYNTWYNFGWNMSEQQLRMEVDRAADLGIEVFYIDDGWFEGSSASGKWGQGAGAWIENHAKFPSGLGNFASYVHGRGMKFGLWVEPERIDSRFVGQASGVDHSWLATRESELVSMGFNGPNDGITPSFQVCLGCPEARAWTIQAMIKVVRDYNVDWLKWDHNMYQVCTDWRHGHQSTTGNWAHIQGVYEVMGALLKEFPDLIIENCAGGGNRFDYGIMRFARVTWTSDVTEPAHVVRTHVFGASHAYPAQYLTTWYVKSTQDLGSIDMKPAQIDSLFRSRMLGAFGISDVLNSWPSQIEDSARRSIKLYKQLRRYLRGKQAWLTPQPTIYAPAMALPTEWDAMQYWLPETDESIIYAFRSGSSEDQIKLAPKFLSAHRIYEISDEDRRIKTYRMSGREIMRDGLVAISAGLNSSCLLYLRPA